MSELANLKLLLAEIEEVRAALIGIVRADHVCGERFNKVVMYLANQQVGIENSITDAEDDEAQQ